jgi:hypothetical protein
MQSRRTRKTAFFPGQFDDVTDPPFSPSKQFTLIYDVPAAMTLYADAVGFTLSNPPAAEGRKIYRWDYVPADKARIERGSVSYFDYGQRLAVSTFADYAALARAYDAGTRDKTVVTPRIKELAAKLTAGLTDPRAKAFALDDWVRKNIRYVAVYIGAGGVVPHAAETVLDNLYGDCKDHVALMEALLAAVGIDSTPALINLGNSYELIKTPTLGLLNHVITFVPSLDLYLDSTAATIGWASELNRYGFRNLKVSDRDQIVPRMLQAMGRKGSGTIDLGDILGTGDTYEIKMAGRIDNLVDLPGPVGLTAISSIVGGIAQTASGFISEKERTQPFVCISSGIDEQASLHVRERDRHRCGSEIGGAACAAP